MNRKAVLRDVLVALSLANLILLRVWSELLTVSPSDGYALRYPPRPMDFYAAILNVLLIAAFLTLAAWKVRSIRHGRVILQVCVLAALVLPLNALRQVVSNSGFAALGAETLRNGGQRAVWTVLVVLAISFAVALIAFRDRIASTVVTILLTCSPFVAVTFGQAFLQAIRYDAAPYLDKPLARTLDGTPRHRVLWLIFDEMDERLTFVNRHPSIQLPELDRFRGASFNATHATAPENATMRSLPALITGETVIDARPISPDDLLLTTVDGRKRHWRDETNIFDRARAEGYNTALAGWYHPYCRVLSDRLTQCSWGELANLYNSTGTTLPAVALNQMRGGVETSLFSPFGQSLATIHHKHTYEMVLAKTLEYATDPRMGFVMAHFSIPHPPYFYDSKTDTFTLSNSPVAGYNDALALADSSLRKVRQAMEAKGVWETTSILISADHGYRGKISVDGGSISDRWVPFMLKLAGAHDYLEFPAELETLYSGELLMRALNGELKTTADAAAFFKARNQSPNSKHLSSTTARQDY